jgi:tRNA dimethylallyltransferase
VRLIRALEIVLSTGKPVPVRTNGSPYEPLYLGVSRPLPELKRRIEKRLDARLKTGMTGEIKHLHANGVSWKRLESFGLEYRWVARFLQGKISRTEMRNALLKDIVAYSKRQLTWWKKSAYIRHVRTTTKAANLTRHFLQGRTS